MKLNINRVEETKGFLSKKTWYILQGTVDFTPEEVTAISKHHWGSDLVATYTRDDGVQIPDTVSSFLRGEFRRPFLDVTMRMEYETKLIESLKQLKLNIDAVGKGSGNSSEQIDL